MSTQNDENSARSSDPEQLEESQIEEAREEENTDASEIPEQPQGDEQVSPARHCCLQRCLGYNKVTLCWISLLFLVIVILTTTLKTRNNYPSNEAKDWIFLGAITQSSATFRVRTDSSNSQAETLVVTNENGNEIIQANITYSQYVDNILVDELESSTRYEYQTLSENGAVIASGSFTTAPAENTRSNFRIATGGCAWTASTAPVFDAIRQTNPLLFLHLGDFHYEDINSPNVETRMEAIDRVMASPQSSLFASTAFVVMWDDHDYLGNDSEGYEPGRAAALESYTLAFPHYQPLPAESTEEAPAVPPYHAFTIGTVRFIIADLRSESTAGSIYSETQKAWLFAELANSTAYDFCVWVTTKPWIGPVKEGDDSWMGSPQDRAELSQHIVDVVTKKNLLAISADAHMVAFDDGRNTYYGSNGTAVDSFPILQSGPLDRLGSNKGGPFSDGCYTTRYERNHQFSTVDFEFGNDENCIIITSYRVNGGDSDVILAKRLCGEIFGSTENAGEGSCDSPTLSSGSIALVSVAGSFVLLSIVCSCWALEKCEASKVSAIMILSFFLSLIAGIGIPLAMGVSQYETFTILIIVLVQMICTFAFIVTWSVRKRSGKV